MIKVKLLTIFLIIIGIFSFSSTVLAQSKPPLVRLSIKTDKRTYEAGEEITLSGFMKNLSSQVVYIQTMRPFLNTKLIIKTPQGRELELIDDRGPFLPTDYSALLPSEEREYFTLKLKSEGLEDEGIASIEPFLEKGRYEINVVYQDLAPLMKRALQGPFASDSITINIVSLKDIQQRLLNKEASIKKRPLKTPEALIEREAAIDRGILVSGEEAIILAKKYIDNQPAYKEKKLTYLYISDTTEGGYWTVCFEEANAGIFHVIKVDAKTGKTEEAYFLD